MTISAACATSLLSRSRSTGKERDSESGLDNFGARYDSSSMGRFMTPDSPSYSNHKNPQSWNLYAFAHPDERGFPDVAFFPRAILHPNEKNKTGCPILRSSAGWEVL
jgi:RHS repeat-associated protein